MNPFSPEGGRDTIYLERDGHRSGPFKCNFGSKKFGLYYPDIDVSEGDKVIRIVPNKEEVYTIHEVDYSSGLGGMSGIPPHWTLSVTKDAAIPRSQPRTTTNHINIHGSTGIQIGDHNVQNLQVALREVLASIDKADAPREEREEAKSRLNSFLAHPLVAAAVGSGLPVALGLLS
ncbi:RIP homotypic interaction motif-containing protein [Pseudomonas syringae]|uniref:RIP homotypic interaction motif-containing protein n=1 Tax=Pseudomonas syringae TaxID=317 RepID=UPI000464B2C5|nr:RIP homotypic interaction motif-containing protein [Pseudomonas syringae]KTB87179.1 hypothetical protein AO072_08840 [Pseudomonas syringae ICMP 13102]